jgi:hypothetical protein
MADMSSPPLENLRMVTPFPNVRATSDAVKLSALTAGVPAVLHMYTS